MGRGIERADSLDFQHAIQASTIWLCLLVTGCFSPLFLPQIPLSMNVSTFLAYDQPTLSYCGVHHELLAHKPYDSSTQEEAVDTHLEPELDLSTITTAARIKEHSQQLA